MYSPRQKQQTGFTLIEMIIIIVIGGIVAVMTTSILTQPVESYIDISRRATLTDIAESSLRRMQRDIQSALPNSIRISNSGKTLELLHVIDGGRYRAHQDTSVGTPSNILDFTVNDTSTAILGALQSFPQLTLPGDLLAIYPLNASTASPTSNAYAGDNTAALTNSSTPTALAFSSTLFPLTSPQQRFFIIDMPITYHCNDTAIAAKDKQLERYEDYPITLALLSYATVSGAIQANYLDECNFNYDSGSSTRAGLITLTLKFTDDEGESVRLVHQVHVDNQP